LLGSGDGSYEGEALAQSHRTDGSAIREGSPGRPAWIAESALVARAHALAVDAHGDQRRATDRRPFLEHVVEVGSLLRDAGYEERLVAAGLLHDAVERGTLSEAGLREAMDDEISDLVLALTEDATIESFAERKEALRQQVKAAGAPAVTIFAADKLSDIRGLARGMARFGDAIEDRMGTTVDGMAGHYEESVAMIEAGAPGSPFVPVLRDALDSLGSAAGEPTPARRRAMA
jgi:guanosine-3',5'-bis(diphosphate) 3'-pyrophosphohydrolase